MLTAAVYNIGLLPVAGTDDLLLPVRAYLDVLKETLRILDGIRLGPMELSTTLEIELDSARHHAAVAYGLVEAHLRRNAADFNASTMDVSYLQNTLALYLQALLRAKAAWNAWLDGQSFSYGMGLGAEGAIPLASGSTAGTLPTVPVLPESAEISKPESTGKLLLMLGGGLALITLISILRK